MWFRLPEEQADALDVSLGQGKLTYTAITCSVHSCGGSIAIYSIFKELAVVEYITLGSLS